MRDDLSFDTYRAPRDKIREIMKKAKDDRKRNQKFAQQLSSRSQASAAQDDSASAAQQAVDDARKAVVDAYKAIEMSLKVDTDTLEHAKEVLNQMEAERGNKAERETEQYMSVDEIANMLNESPTSSVPATPSVPATSSVPAIPDFRDLPSLQDFLKTSPDKR